MMPRPQRKHSYAEENALLEWMAGHGGTYDQYNKFCDQFHIPTDRRFTERSFYGWQQRHRDRLRKAREEQKQSLREGSIMDRRNRLKMLETNLSEIQRILDQDEMLSPLDKIKLMEQQRKMLESVSRERGEWGQAPEDPDVIEQREANRRIADLMQKHYSDKDKT